MAEITPFTEDEEGENLSSGGDVKLLRDELRDRCKKAGIETEDDIDFISEEPALRIAMPCGREKRWLYASDHAELTSLLSISFEKYTFLAGLDAICLYTLGYIEALVRPLASSITSRLAYSKLFGISSSDLQDKWASLEVKMESPASSNTSVILSPASKELKKLIGCAEMSISLKIRKDGVSQNEQALDLLRKVADSVFFQVDLLADVPFTLARDRRSIVRRKTKFRGVIAQKGLEFPRVEYDSAPMSLYWYARSATGMPLLQFLAFYQVIEFYYPTYSQAEAGRKLKVLLKDPTFRADRDADIGKVLSSIQISRSGGFGDERSQLKATLSECVDAGDLREFVTADKERSEFLSSKSKGLTDHKLPISNPTADLRPDVAERLYEIRCRIVHTKIDTRSGELDLLLPFSKEAEQLHFDIELAQYLAQRILVAASTPFQGG